MKILVIEARGLHLGYLGCYGNEWVATPNLDRLASEGVLFDWHFADQPGLDADIPWQERSLASGRYCFPGQKPSQVGPPFHPIVTRVDAIAALAPVIKTALASDGDWHWLEGPNLLPPWRLDEELLDAYFDEDDVEEGLVPWPDPPLGPAALDDAQIVQLQNSYAAAVTCFDAQLGVALDALRKAQLLDGLLLCVTARSGLPLGEHGMIGSARPLLHDELVHVPLLLRLPGAAHAGLRIGALTQPIDLLPTFLEYAAQAGDNTAMHGRSLWPLIRGEQQTMRDRAVSALRIAAEECWLLRTPAWALHLPTGEEMPRLFAKPADRWEVNDLYARQGDIADALAAELRAFVTSIGGQSAM